MAIVTRYFSTTAAGAGDGTTFADRAELFSAGNWSTVITGFDFSGTDSLLCMIEGALTYTCGQLFSSALWTQAPRLANPMMMIACDGSGNEWVPPDPDWSSAQPVWDTSGQPLLSMSSTGVLIGTAHVHFYGIRFLHSSRNGGVIASAGDINWFTIENSTANTAAIGIDGVANMRPQNGVVTMSGTAYNTCLNQVTDCHNIRCAGNASASSGNRNGVRNSSNITYSYDRITVLNHVGDGIAQTSTGTSARLILTHSTIDNCDGDGVQLDSGATSIPSQIHQCLISNSGGYGINIAGAVECSITDTRLRDNTSGNITGAGNYPASGHGIYTTDAADTEYADYGAGDLRVANDATVAFQGYGSGQEPAAGGGSTLIICGE